MVRPKDPGIRRTIVDRAAVMLRDREPVTLRSLVDGTGVSTMAVYTYFGGIDGVWRSVRQEGFTRLARKLVDIGDTDDPLADFTAQLATYVQYALDDPDLFRVMFDATIELEDAQAADDILERLVRSVRRCRDDGRFRADVDPLGFATQCWMVCHGLVSLIANGPLPFERLADGPSMLHAQFVGVGADPDTCDTSIQKGWVAPTARP